jgi:hypothetical protein
VSLASQLHHLVKTFWGWGEQQLADGTLILTSPAGHTYVTTPGSRPTGGVPAPRTDPPADYCGERAAMMPKRRRTRAQDRAARIAAERRHNRDARTARREEAVSFVGPAPPPADEEPPPF